MGSGELDPDYVVPPGETLKDWMIEYGVNVETLADDTQIQTDRLKRILEGRGHIGTVTACKLAQVTEIPARFWLAREDDYRKGLAAGKKVFK